ncbi:MAG: hypothetical protein ACTHMV_13535 [Chitinophagaceae bacterium]
MSTFRWKLLKPLVIEQAIEHMNWLFEGFRITRQLIPEYGGMYGPSGDFDNFKMAEFHFSEQYYRELKEGGDSLDKLVGVLYRPGKSGYDRRRDPDGDTRIPFNENLITWSAKKISRWPNAVKISIFIWYDSCRQALEENNPLVFKVDSEYESQFDTGMYGIMRSLAGDKLGPVEKIEQLYVHHAMMEIGLIREEQEFFEKKIKEIENGSVQK